MKKNFKLSNLPSLLLVVYIIKSFIVDPVFYDYLVITLMSIGAMYSLKINKDELSDKDEMFATIKEFEENYTKRLIDIQKAQDHDRMAADTKFSTLNLGIQRQGIRICCPKKRDRKTKKTSYEIQNTS